MFYDCVYSWLTYCKVLFLLQKPLEFLNVQGYMLNMYIPL